jgi:hypothetical protein
VQTRALTDGCGKSDDPLNAELICISRLTGWMRAAEGRQDEPNAAVDCRIGTENSQHGTAFTCTFVG